MPASVQLQVNLKQENKDFGTSSHLLTETKGPQEGIHVIKFSIAKTLQPFWVTGLSRQTHCTDLYIIKVMEKHMKRNYCRVTACRMVTAHVQLPAKPTAKPRKKSLIESSVTSYGKLPRKAV